MITRSMKRLIKESSTNLTIDVTVKSDNLKKRHYTQSKDDDKNADKKLRRSRKIKRKKDVKNSDLIIKGEPKLDFESKEVKNELVIDTVKKEAVGDTKAKLVGAHVSVAGMHSKQNDGGLENAPVNASLIGAKSFGLFLRSQRKWTCKPLEEDTINKFKQACKLHGFTPDSILPHGSYLLNCGAPNPETLRKSREALIDELQRCEKLGLSLYNFHPGSTCGEISVDQCLDRIGESINLAHANTKYVITVVENMSRQGHTVGGDFKELKGIIDRVKDKSRVGVCLDTCHAFAAGFDLSTEEGFQEMMNDFESIVGLKYLKALHLNDSKGKVGCHLDRHENIGKGFIGLKGFQRIMQDPRFTSLPMILETPYDSDVVYDREIKLLLSLI